jgi:hypothetical protein
VCGCVRPIWTSLTASSPLSPSLCDHPLHTTSLACARGPAEQTVQYSTVRQAFLGPGWGVCGCVQDHALFALVRLALSPHALDDPTMHALCITTSAACCHGVHGTCG